MKVPFNMPEYTQILYIAKGPPELNLLQFQFDPLYHEVDLFIYPTDWTEVSEGGELSFTSAFSGVLDFKYTDNGSEGSALLRKVRGAGGWCHQSKKTLEI